MNGYEKFCPDPCPLCRVQLPDPCTHPLCRVQLPNPLYSPTVQSTATYSPVLTHCGVWPVLRHWERCAAGWQKVWAVSSEMKECQGCREVITVMDTDRLTCHSLYLISGSHSHPATSLITRTHRLVTTPVITTHHPSPLHNTRQHDTPPEKWKIFPTILRKSSIPLTNIPFKSCQSHICYSGTAATDNKNCQNL